MVLLEAEINKLTIPRIKEELKKGGVVTKSTSKKAYFSKIIQDYTERSYPCVSNKIVQYGNTPGYEFPMTSYFDFKEHGEGEKVVDESFGRKFRGEVLRYPTLSE